MVGVETHGPDVDLGRHLGKELRFLGLGEVLVVAQDEDGILGELEVPAVGAVLLEIYEVPKLGELVDDVVEAHA